MLQTWFDGRPPGVLWQSQLGRANAIRRHGEEAAMQNRKSGENLGSQIIPKYPIQMTIGFIWIYICLFFLYGSITVDLFFGKSQARNTMKSGNGNHRGRKNLRLHLGSLGSGPLLLRQLGCLATG